MAYVGQVIPFTIGPAVSGPVEVSAYLSGGSTLSAYPMGIVSNPVTSGDGALAATRSQIYSPTSSLTGGGALSASAVGFIARGPALAGDGTLSATAIEFSLGSVTAALSGNGVLGVTKYQIYANAPDSNGSGALSASAMRCHPMTATLTGGGTVSASTNQTYQRSVPVAGSGTLSATAIPAGTVAGTLTGAGVLSASVKAMMLRAVALSGAGVFSAIALGPAMRSTALSGSGTLSATVRPVYSTPTSLSSSGTLVGIIPVAAPLGGGWTVSPPEPPVIPTQGWTTTPAVSLPAPGRGWLGTGVTTIVGGPSSAGQLSVATLARPAVTALFNGGSALGTTVLRREFRATALLGAGALAVPYSQKLPSAPLFSGTAFLFGDTVSTHLEPEFGGEGLLSANTDGLTARVGIGYGIDGPFGSQGILAGSYKEIHLLMMSFLGTGTLTGPLAPKLVALLTGSGQLSSPVFACYSRAAALLASGTLSATDFPNYPRPGALTGLGVLTNLLQVLLRPAPGGAGTIGALIKQIYDAPAQITNICPDPGFEDGTNWFNWNAPGVQSTEQAHSGSKSRKVTGTGNWMQLFLTLNASTATPRGVPFQPTAPGRKVHAEAWIRAHPANVITDGYVYVRIFAIDAAGNNVPDGNILNMFNGASIPSDRWTKYEIDGIMPANTTEYYAEVLFSSGILASDSYYIDDAIVLGGDITPLAGSGALTGPSFARYAIGFGDDFNRSDSTTSPGNGWTNRVGVMGITGNALYGVGGDWNVASAPTPMSSDNMEASIVLGPMVGSGGDHVMIDIGCSESGEGAFLYIASSSSFFFFTQTAWGAWTQGPAVGTPQMYAGDRVTVRRVGDVYTGLLNDVPYLTWPDSTNIVPRDANHRLVGASGYNTGGSYRTINSFSTRDIEWLSGNGTLSASVVGFIPVPRAPALSGGGTLSATATLSFTPFNEVDTARTNFAKPAGVQHFRVIAIGSGGGGGNGNGGSFSQRGGGGGGGGGAYVDTGIQSAALLGATYSVTVNTGNTAAVTAGAAVTFSSGSVSISAGGGGAGGNGGTSAAGPAGAAGVASQGGMGGVTLTNGGAGAAGSTGAAAGGTAGNTTTSAPGGGGGAGRNSIGTSFASGKGGNSSVATGGAAIGAGSSTVGNPGGNAAAGSAGGGGGGGGTNSSTGRAGGAGGTEGAGGGGGAAGDSAGAGAVGAGGYIRIEWLA